MRAATATPSSGAAATTVSPWRATPFVSKASAIGRPSVGLKVTEVTWPSILTGGCARMSAMSCAPAGIAVALSTGVPLRAHHSGSTLFDETTTTLKGVVKDWLWSNPHCLLTIEAPGADGQAVVNE